jgi:hypothetical protein
LSQDQNKESFDSLKGGIEKFLQEDDSISEIVRTFKTKWR